LTHARNGSSTPEMAHRCSKSMTRRRNSSPALNGSSQPACAFSATPGHVQIAGSATVSRGARVQRFWRDLAARRSSSSGQQPIEPQLIRALHFGKLRIRIAVTGIAACHGKESI
ncbi:hypothetical protein PAXRUDRAFT_836445, partial [Paxillus rubicundulus Ve08.2h10]